MRLLLAEDETELSEALVAILKHNNYSVDAVYNGEDALNYLVADNYDGAILDIMMPKADGYQVLEALRASGKETPVLFLTARDAIEDRVRGLDSGACDYLVKPFSLEELAARVRAALRISHGKSTNLLTMGDLTVDCGAHRVTRGGKLIELSAKEYALLEYLMLNQGIVLSREKIENHIWNFDYEGGTNVVDVYISYLRKKIDGGHEKRLIHTVRGRGYVLREEA